MLPKHMFRKKNHYQKSSGAYISEIDQCLANFNQNHAWSATQLAEITKHKRIFHLRNTPCSAIRIKSLWDFD